MWTSDCPSLPGIMLFNEKVIYLWISLVIVVSGWITTSLSLIQLSALITKLTKEKDSALEQNKKLRSELELVRRDASKQGGFSLIFVLVCGLLSIILGYLVKKWGLQFHVQSNDLIPTVNKRLYLVVFIVGQLPRLQGTVFLFPPFETSDQTKIDEVCKCPIDVPVQI